VKTARSSIGPTLKSHWFLWLVSLCLLVATVSGCSSVSMMLSCGDEPQVDEARRERFRVRLVVEQDGRTQTDESTITCRPVGSECAGGTWYTKWATTPRRPRPLAVHLSGGELVSVKPPGCSGMLGAAGEGDQYWRPWSNPVIRSGRDEEKIFFRSDLRRELLAKYGIEHMGLEVVSLEGESHAAGSRTPAVSPGKSSREDSSS